MACPPCGSRATTRRRGRTALSYRRFTCQSCRHRFNERTGTPFNDLQFPTDVVLLAVLWRLRYKLARRDVAELLLQRGFEVTYETIRVWEFRFAPVISDRLRNRRRGHGGRSWYRVRWQRQRSGECSLLESPWRWCSPCLPLRG